jgi:integrase
MQWGDIHDGIIDVCHNYVNYEGMKDTPKWGSTRVVPLPDEVAEVLEVVKTTLPFEIRPNGFVFESLENPGQPMGETFFRNSLERELVAIGIAGSWHGKKVAPESYVNEQSKRNLTFHGLRHTFITLSRLAGISDLEIQTLGGHKSGEMMNRYTHAAQVMDMSAVKAKIEKALAKPVTTEHSSIASQSTTELTLAEGSL